MKCSEARCPFLLSLITDGSRTTGARSKGAREPVRARRTPPTAASSCSRHRLQVARLRRRVPPGIVSPVEVLERRVDHLGRLDVVERGHVDGDVLAADLLDVAFAEGPHAAMLAEQMVRALRAELVVREIALAREQAEVFGLDDHAPIAHLRAIAAIAAAGAGAEIDIGFVADGAAVAAAGVGLLHGCLLFGATGKRT